MRKLLFILPLILLVACQKESETPNQEAEHIENNIYLYYKNNSGKNLLNPSITKAISVSDIDVLDLSNQGYKIYFQDSQNTNAITVLEHPSYGKIVKLPFQSGIKNGNKMTKFLEYSDYKEDKITIEVSDSSIKKIWLNDVLVATNPEPHSFDPIVVLK